MATKAKQAGTVEGVKSTILKMIQLKREEAEIRERIEESSEGFMAACYTAVEHAVPGIEVVVDEAKDKVQLEVDGALIFKKKTAGKWDWSKPILALMKQLKEMQKRFKDKYEPISGQDEYWSVSPR